jgi:hypothetical protein
MPQEFIFEGKSIPGFTLKQARKHAEVIYGGKKTLRELEVQSQESGGMVYYNLVKHLLTEIRERPAQRKREALASLTMEAKPLPPAAMKKEFAQVISGLNLYKGSAESLRRG